MDNCAGSFYTSLLQFVRCGIKDSVNQSIDTAIFVHT